MPPAILHRQNNNCWWVVSKKTVHVSLAKPTAMQDRLTLDRRLQLASRDVRDPQLRFNGGG
jgi:hypothetical protein